MEGVVTLISMILLLSVVAPTWIVMHYRSKKQKESGISEEEHSRLQELTAIADAMMDRIETLESILDQETPNWRKKHERG